MRKNNEIDILESLSIMANIMQFANYFENLEQSSNDEIIKELHQQNETYLKYIIEQNDVIIELLKELKK